MIHIYLISDISKNIPVYSILYYHRVFATVFIVEYVLSSCWQHVLIISPGIDHILELKHALLLLIHCTIQLGLCDTHMVNIGEWWGF